MLTIKNLAAKIRREEWLAILVFVVAMTINILIYDQKFSAWEALRWMITYFTFGEPFYNIFFVVVYALAFFYFYRGLFEMCNDWFLHQKRPNRAAIAQLFKKFIRPLRVIFPLGLTAISTYQVLSHLSYALRFSGRDLLLAVWDQRVVGGLLFFYLPTWFKADWIAHLSYYGYLSLSVVMSLLMVFLFLFKKDRMLRLATAAFIFSSTFSFPLFYLMPCQDPGHYFITNDRNNTIPVGVASEMANYHPSELAKSKMLHINQAEMKKDKDNAVPISCFPSMHAVWAIIAIYFMARLSRWTILLSLPWLFVTLFGGLYYAQHYLVDYIVGIPIAMSSIGAAYFLFKFKHEG
jgi:hypothetical protein